MIGVYKHNKNGLGGGGGGLGGRRGLGGGGGDLGKVHNFFLNNFFF